MCPGQAECSHLGMVAKFAYLFLNLAYECVIILSYFGELEFSVKETKVLQGV